MIHTTPTIVIDESEIQLEFMRASKPGGQSVNKVGTAVQLRFAVSNSPSLPDDVRERLVHVAGRRITQEAVLIIKAQRFRTQDQNRQDAIGRLIELIRKAAEKPKLRRRTRPTPASKRQWLESKRCRGQTKRVRRSVPPSEE